VTLVIERRVTGPAAASPPGLDFVLVAAVPSCGLLQAPEGDARPNLRGAASMWTTLPGPVHRRSDRHELGDLVLPATAGPGAATVPRVRTACGRTNVPPMRSTWTR
jgi:hypothetical protein